MERLKRGVDILTATPGRLLDLSGQGLLDLSGVEIFVLDEADRMLDMGFIHDVRRVIKLLPQKKQTMFFSATLPPEIMDLVDTLLHDPVRAVPPRCPPRWRSSARRSAWWTGGTRPASSWPSWTRSRWATPWSSPAPSTGPTRWPGT